MVKIGTKLLNKMKKHPTLTTILATLIFLILVATVVFCFYIYQKNKQVDYVLEQASKVQETADDFNSLDDLYLKIDGNNVLGVVEIDKINYKGLVYETTNLDVLGKGIGHFESSPIFEGNVCLAGHNYIGVWKNLYTLKTGDSIKYTCILGSKTYKVLDVKTIEYNDLSVLENTKENTITLITCIKNTPSKRLCVSAIEE